MWTQCWHKASQKCCAARSIRNQVPSQSCFLCVHLYICRRLGLLVRVFNVIPAEMDASFVTAPPPQCDLAPHYSPTQPLFALKPTKHTARAHTQTPQSAFFVLNSTSNYYYNIARQRKPKPTHIPILIASSAVNIKFLLDQTLVSTRCT